VVIQTESSPHVSSGKVMPTGGEVEDAFAPPDSFNMQGYGVSIDDDTTPLKTDPMASPGHENPGIAEEIPVEREDDETVDMVTANAANEEEGEFD